jgi:hypothetical protein
MIHPGLASVVRDYMLDSLLTTETAGNTLEREAFASIHHRLSCHETIQLVDFVSLPAITHLASRIEFDYDPRVSCKITGERKQRLH